MFDPFAGTKGWLRPFEVRGHEVFSNDLDPKFDTDLHKDVRDLSLSDLPWIPNVVPASPPCTAFSQGSNRWHFRKTNVCSGCGLVIEYVASGTWIHEQPSDCTVLRPVLKKSCIEPKSDGGRLGVELLRWTLEFIQEVQPEFFIIENPVALMRRMPELEDLERQTTSYCQYGMWYRKPTDLWGGFPSSWSIRPQCDAVGGQVVISSNEFHNDVPYRVSPSTGRPCHEKAERGSRLGTQGLTTAEAGHIPYELALDACLAMEREAA